MSDTNYKYVSNGPNWAWGRNKIEQTVWRWIRIAAIVGAISGVTMGVLLGLWLMNMVAGLAFGVWPVVWIILLAVTFGLGTMILLITVTYKWAEFASAFNKNKDLSQLR